MELERIERVVDGDSIWVILNLGFGISLRKEIRLLNVDAPEKNTKAGKLVKQFVEQWIEKYKNNITLDLKDDTDKFGRLLGLVINNNNQSLNSLLIENKIVHEFDGTGKRSWTDEQLKNVELILENIFTPPASIVENTTSAI